MKYVSICIRQNETIITLFKKNNNVIIKNVIQERSILDLVVNNQVSAIEEFLYEVIENNKCKNAVISITVPAFLCRQDYWQTERKGSVELIDKETFISWVEANLKKDIEIEYSIGLPIIQNYEKKVYVSGVGINKKYIDTLYTAFMNCDLDLENIEIDAVSYVRLVSIFQKNNSIIIDFDGTYINIIHFCPKIGMYTISISSTEDDYDQIIKEIQMYAATWDFKDKGDLQYFTVGNYKQDFLIEFNKYFKAKTLNLPGCVNSERYRKNLIAIPIGNMYRKIYKKGENYIVDQDELSSQNSRSETRLPFSKEKIKAKFNFSNWNINIGNLFRKRDDRL